MIKNFIVPHKTLPKSTGHHEIP